MSTNTNHHKSERLALQSTRSRIRQVIEWEIQNIHPSYATFSEQLKLSQYEKRMIIDGTISHNVSVIKEQIDTLYAKAGNEGHQTLETYLEITEMARHGKFAVSNFCDQEVQPLISITSTSIIGSEPDIENVAHTEPTTNYDPRQAFQEEIDASEILTCEDKKKAARKKQSSEISKIRRSLLRMERYAKKKGRNGSNVSTKHKKKMENLKGKYRQLVESTCDRETDRSRFCRFRKKLAL